MMTLDTLALEPSADDRATEFSAITGDTGEHFNGYTLMVEAYAAIWLIMMAWIFFLWRKQATLTARLDGLEGAIARAQRNRGDGATGKAKPSETA